MVLQPSQDGEYHAAIHEPLHPRLLCRLNQRDPHRSLERVEHWTIVKYCADSPQGFDKCFVIEVVAHKDIALWDRRERHMDSLSAGGRVCEQSDEGGIDLLK